MIWGMIQSWLQLFIFLAFSAGFLFLLATGLVFIGILLLPLALWVFWQIRQGRKRMKEQQVEAELSSHSQVITVEYTEVAAPESRSNHD